MPECDASRTVSLVDFLSLIAGHLRAWNIEFMVTGSAVSSYYGEPRTTLDLDIVVNAVEPPDHSIRMFVDRCEGSGLYLPAELIFEPTIRRRRQFNVISSTTGWMADIMWVTDRPYSHLEFSRRVTVELLAIEIPIPTAEDIVLAKLERGGSIVSRQFRDAVSVIRVMSPSLDLQYLSTWADELGISDLLTAAIDEALS
jgi:hypothetical protein